MPLVLLLHGLGDTGDNLARGVGLESIATKLGFSFAAPDGALDRHGRRHWNAGAACCDFDGLAVPHGRLLAELPSHYERHHGATFGDFVVAGFSNGSFMAQRLACDEARVSGIVAIAGAYPGPSDPPCAPRRPARVVVVHGDRDKVVPYEGGPLLRDARRVVGSALQTARAWAKHSGCALEGATSSERDLVPRLEGAETEVLAFARCNAPVELWTVRGADHVGVLSPPLVEAALERALGR